MTIEIASFRGNYSVNFSNGFTHELHGEIESDDWLIVDQSVAELYESALAPFLQSNRHRLWKAEEKTKSYEFVELAIRELIEGGFKRNNRLIAIGGGIIQDAVAFTASILYRGVDWIFLPTTLLAQGDSCIGSKTSLNFGEYKNMLGGFHPPRSVVIDPNFLGTLTENEVRSGLGEMTHYFMIGGRPDFEMIRDLLDECLADVRATRKLTERSLEIKKAMIELDEFDEGPRKVFNYGHSFGHALESYTNYEVPHGIAISYGMDLANRVSVQFGLLSEQDFLEARSLFERIWEGTSLPKVDVKSYLELLSKDKKNVGAKLNLILTRGFGDMFMQSVVPDQGFVDCIEESFAYYDKVGR